MPELSTILAFCAATVALLLIPGPAVIYILNRSIGDGRKVGLAAVGGLEVGDAIQVLFASLGLSAVLAAWWIDQTPPIGIIPGIVLILVGCVLVVTRTRGASND